jgi:large subunit ribosomal protein L30
MSRLRITLCRSTIGYPKDQKQTARALGLSRINQTVVRTDTPAMRGMVQKLQHMLAVEEIPDEVDGGEEG